MRPCLLIGVACASIGAAHGRSHADVERQFLDLINHARNRPSSCGGKVPSPSAGVTPEPALAKVRISDGDLLQALRKAGFVAKKAEAMIVNGTDVPQRALDIVLAHHCNAVLNPDYTMAGVQYRSGRWQIVLAEPLFPSGLPAWQTAGRQILEQVNAARSRGRRCGSQQFSAAPPLKWNERLGMAALAHSRDMASKDYFEHDAPDGSTAAQRATREGYAWSRIGENLATGQSSPDQVVRGWLSSPGHCANIMNGAFTEMGASYATNSESRTVIFWTQVLGRPRQTR